MHHFLKPRLLVILGPTAAGKSSLAVKIAKEIGTEIVSADSVQVYRHLDIGTAKPSPSERREIPHHLIDIVDPDKEFNAGTYRRAAKEAIGELHKKSAKIILVGGTYLYVRVLLKGLIEEISADEEIRNDLRKLKSAFGISYVYEKLKSLDPDSASRIHPNDYVRIERALEAYYLTGEKMSALQRRHGFSESEYDVLKIGLSEDRESLRKKIDERVDDMIRAGFVDEVEGLREMGFGKNLKPMQSIGYKQINRFLDKDITLDEAVQLIKRYTKHFAKRQMTWLRADKDIRWYGVPEDLDKVMSAAEDFFRR